MSFFSFMEFYNMLIQQDFFVIDKVEVLDRSVIRLGIVQWQLSHTKDIMTIRGQQAALFSFTN